MGLFLDILTGRIFNFRNAKASDVNTGTSDNLIVTPKSLAGSEVFCNTSIPLVFTSPLSTKTTTFTASTYQVVIPSNGFLFPNRGTKVKIQVFANVIADIGSTGELCIWDANANVAVANTNFSFTNTGWAIVGSPIYLLDAGKVYTIAIRKKTGTNMLNVQLRSATMTLQIPVL
jgi:hypothetical protein